MNLKKYMLLSLFTILAVISCGKPEEPKDENVDEIQIDQTNSADTNNNNNNQQAKANTANPQESQATQTTQTATEIPQSGNEQPPSQVKPEEVKASKTLQHLDKLMNKEIAVEDRILVFSKKGNQYLVTYKVENENGLSTDVKNLTFNEKSDSLTDGIYTFKLNKNKLGLYAGNQFIFSIE